jgi:TPR repeat protein
LHETTAAIAETRPKIAAGDTQIKQGAAETQPQSVGATSTQANPEADKAGEQAQQRLSANNDRAASLAPVLRSEPAAKLAPPAADAARAQAERFVTNGDRYLAQGNIVIARQYYLRAADLGVASAAVKLAATHDPHEMAQLGVVGLAANPEEAKRWYQRAALLGAVEAEARLRRLEAR